MPFDLRNTSVNATVTLSFAYSGIIVTDNIGARPRIEVFCEDGMLGSLYFDATPNGPNLDIFETRNGTITLLASIPGDGSAPYAIAGSYSLTFQTTQWVRMPGGSPYKPIDSEAEFYERLRADQFPNPPAVGHAGSGARLYTLVEGCYVPSFVIRLTALSTVNGIRNITSSVTVGASSRSVPPSMPSLDKTLTHSTFGWTTRNQSGPGGVSSNTDVFAAPGAPNGGLFGGSAVLTYCHACPVQVTGDLYEYGSAWAGANAKYDLYDLNRETEAQRLWRFNNGLRYDCHDRGEEGDPQFNTYTSAGAGISRSFTQEFYDVDVGEDLSIVVQPGSCPSYSLSQLGRYIKNSFQPVGFGRGLEGPGFLISPAYDVLSLQHVGSQIVDSFGNAALWSWAADATYAAPTVAMVGGTLQILTHATKKALGSRVWPTFIKTHAWRYFDFTIRSVGAANKLVIVRIDGALPLLPITDEDQTNLIAHRLEFDAMTGADGVWVTRRIDGCAPTRVYQVNGAKYIRQVKDALQGTQSSFEVATGAPGEKKRSDLFGRLQFGVNINVFEGLALELEANSTYELDLLTNISVGGHEYHFAQEFEGSSPVLYAWFDKRVALWVEDYEAAGTLLGLQQFIGSREPGWSVTASASTHAIWNMDREAKFLGGGGWIYDGGWQHQRERSNAGAITHRAQGFARSVRCYPGQPDPVTGTATLTLRFRTQASRQIFGSVFKEGVKVPDADLNVWNQNTGFVTPNVSAIADVDGWYAVKTAARLDSDGYLVGLLEPYVVELMSTPADGAPQPRMQILYPWQQASFWVGSAPSHGGEPLEIDSPRGWMWTAEGLRIRCYHASDATLAFESVAYSAYASIEGLSYDPRMGFLFILADRGDGTHRVLKSEDAGLTATEVLTVTATSSAIENDSERGLVVLLYHDGASGVKRRISTDKGATFEAAAAVTAGGANLDGVVHALRADPRTGYYYLTSTISGDLRVLRSEDCGLTWTQVLA